MGLDIYAGTLSRYYAHNWKTPSSNGRKKTASRFKKSNRTAAQSLMRRN